MKVEYDAKIEKWVATDDVFPITVKGPTRAGCEERLAELAARYKGLQEEAGAVLRGNV